MQNVEINVKVNGKEVPLSTISTETFEKVKSAEKVKDIPVARLATCRNDGAPRLILKMPKDIKKHLDSAIIVIDLENGRIVSWNDTIDGFDDNHYYKNHKPLEELI